MFQARNKVFQAPSIEWIENRISEFEELLQLNTSESAIALRKLLGPMKLEAQYPDVGKPYYVAHSSINALAITEPLSNSENLDNGSNSFQWWARSQRVRTFSQLQFHIRVLDAHKTSKIIRTEFKTNFIYQ